MGQNYSKAKMSMNKLKLFHKTLTKYFHNFIPNKNIICDDRDPPWMNDGIKKMIKRKNWLFQNQRKSFDLDFTNLNLLKQDVLNAITSSKLKYHERLANKLNNSKTAIKKILENTKNICK